MMHDHPRFDADWHDPDCDCGLCLPAGPGPAARADRTALQVATMIVAGLVVGQLLCWILDRFVDGAHLGLLRVYGVTW